MITQYNIVTYEDMQSLFETLIDDQLDSVTENVILNQAKDDLESLRQWQYLIGIDVSQSANPGDTYLTMKTLPSDFFSPLESGIYVGSDLVPYQKFPLEDRAFFQSISHGYYIDVYNGQYAILGQPNPGGVITFPYKRSTLPLAALVNGASPAGTINQPKFPVQFRALIPYRASQMYFAIDQGDKSRAWDDRWSAFYTMLLDSMIRWDFRMAKQSYANRMMANRVDLTGYPNIISGML